MKIKSHAAARLPGRNPTRRAERTVIRAAIELLESRRLLATSAWASPGVDGRLVYATNGVGDRIPDFSMVGYKTGNVPLPNTTGGVTVPVKLTLNPGAPGVDMTAAIQAAIDDVSNDAMDANGFRGAVKLNAGNYPISGTLHISASGVVLMGVGDSSTTGTRLEATGTATRFLIEVDGTGSRASSGSTYTITDSYTPVGARSFHVSSTASLSVGDSILVNRPSPANWIHDIGMDLLDNPWTAGSKDQNWERTVTAISGNLVTIDIPLTNSLDVQYGGGSFRHYTYSGRINQVGISDLYMYSDSLGAGDLAHATGSVSMDKTIDGWMHNITSDGFAVNQIIIEGGSKFCTIDDAVVQNTTVSSQAPPAGISVNGSLNLVQNVTEHGVYHAVALTSQVAGPNVIYNLTADGTGSDCGPHQRWSTGGLFDNTTIVGNDLQAFNRGNSGTGHGWAGANYVFWNCSARNLEIANPPTAQNWAIGCSGTQAGDGIFESLGAAINPPISLYQKQLWERTHANPAITTLAGASPNPRSGSTTNLSVAASGTAPLNYTWSCISKPAGAPDPTYSQNGSTAAANTTATFGAAGTYIFKVTVSDAGGLLATNTVIVTDRPTTTLNGDQQSANQNDVFLVNRSGNNIQIFRNASLILTQDFGTSPQLAINAAGGEDNITFDFTGGNPIPANGFVVDAGAGIGDQVSVIGSAGADAVTLATGNVSINGNNFLYASAESMLLNLGAGGDTLNVTGGNSAITTSSLWLTVSGGATGSLTMGASSTLPDITNLTVSAGATFDLNGQNQTVDFFNSDGTVRNNAAGTSATFSIGKYGGSGSVTGAIINGSGTVALTKLGFGAVTLSGANSYSGVTTISGGVIASGNSASLAGLSGAVWFNGGTFHVTANTTSANVSNKYATTFTGASAASTGTFDIDAGVILTIGTAGGSAAMRTNGGGSHGGRFTKTGAGTIRILSGNPQQDDPFQLNQGTIILEHADGLGKADAGVKLDMKSGTTLVLKQDASTNFQTPVNSLDIGGTINLVIDRLNPGPAVTHSFNTLTSSGAFTLNLTSGSNVTSGAPGLSIGNVILSGAGTFNIANSLAVTGPVSGAFTLTKSGAGIMTLSGANTYTGATTVSAGTFAVSGAAAIPAASAVTVNGSATYRMSGVAAAFKLASLTVSSSATARVDPDGDSTLITDTLTLTSLGKLQLSDNDLVVNNGSFTTIRNQMIQGFNNGGLSGISSSTDGSQILALFDNALVGSGTWNGQPIGASAIVGKYTWFGDVNMDGQVTGDDYTIIDSNLNTTPPAGLAWLSGDANLDGIVTGDDYTTVDSNLNLGVGNPLSPGDRHRSTGSPQAAQGARRSSLVLR